MKTRGAIVLIAGAVAIGACTSPPSGAAQGGIQQTAPPAPPAADASANPGWPEDLPVDPSLEPVSRSNPSAEAKAAMDQCIPADWMDKVVGMAEVPASEVRRFSLTNGNEPELRRAKGPAWAVQFNGEFLVRTGDTIIDPLCVFVDGISHLYAPYGRVGEEFRPPADFEMPTAALPPLEL